MRVLLILVALSALSGSTLAAADAARSTTDEAVGLMVQQAQQQLKAILDSRKGSQSPPPELLAPPLAILDQAIDGAAEPSGENALNAHMLRSMVYQIQGRVTEANAEYETILAGDAPPKMIEKAVGSLAGAYEIAGDVGGLERLAETAKRHGMEQEDIDQLGKMAAALRVATGQPFPDFTLVDLAGATHHLSDYRGKVLLLDFWATWCGPCLRGMPRVKQAYAALHERGLEILGVSLDEERGRLTSFLTTAGMPWPQCCDEKAWKGDFVLQLGIGSIPALYVIGPDGRLFAKNLHCDDLDLATLLDALVPKAK